MKPSRKTEVGALRGAGATSVSEWKQSPTRSCPQPRILTFYISAIVVALAGAMPAQAAGTARIVSVERIWNGAPHCAFTDLLRHDGRWFCTFREGAGHVPELVGGQQSDGAIRILMSRDGRSWTATALLTEPTIDLRDPHLSAMPDGRLMIVMGGSLYVGTRYIARQSRVSFSQDGVNWSPVQPILTDGDWLWRVTWHRGRAYGVNKRVPGKNNPRLPKRGMLVTSKDGVHWDVITELAVPGIDEATVIFGPADEMQILVRRESDNNHAWLGRSAPPYTQWTWQDCGEQVGGPNLVQIPEHGLWGGGRSYPQRKTVLAEIAGGRFVPKLVLPSGDDTSYPGFVWHDGLLWMSYYSSHETTTAIYLAKIQFGP